MNLFNSAVTISTLMIGTCLAQATVAEVADLAISNGRIITMDAQRSRASAIAIRDGEIVYVGAKAGLDASVGPETNVIDAGGKIVLPGLHDVHIHPLFSVSPHYCVFRGHPAPCTDSIRHPIPNLSGR